MGRQEGSKLTCKAVCRHNGVRHHLESYGVNCGTVLVFIPAAAGRCARRVLRAPNQLPPTHARTHASGESACPDQVEEQLSLRKG